MTVKNLWIAALAAASLAAQESPTVYARAGLSLPYQHLGDALDHKLGLSLALGVEVPIEDAWRWRVDGGYTRFLAGQDPTTGDSIRASVAHLSVEGVYQLRDVPGPYLFAGIGGYVWSVPIADTSGTVSQQRRGRVGGTLGLGWRLNKTFFGELRASGGTVDPGFTALWLTASAGMHF